MYSEQMNPEHKLALYFLMNDNTRCASGIMKHIPLFLSACFQSSLEISSVHTCLISSDIDCKVNVSLGFRLRNQISNFVVLSPIFAVSPISVILMLFLYMYKSRFWKKN